MKIFNEQRNSTLMRHLTSGQVTEFSAVPLRGREMVISRHRRFLSHFSILTG